MRPTCPKPTGAGGGRAEELPVSNDRTRCATNRLDVAAAASPAAATTPSLASRTSVRSLTWKSARSLPVAFARRATSGGRMVTIAFDLDHPVTSLGWLAASSVFGSRRVRFFLGDPKADLLAELTALTERGALRPVVERGYPLADIAEAHRALEAGGVRGKLVVTVG